MSAEACEFEAKKFVNLQVEEIRRALGGEKALVALSGGVDSTTSAILTYKAVGKNLLCVLLDTGFMRIGEPQRIKRIVSQRHLSLPLEIVDMTEKFASALLGVENAEEKRKIFRQVFYDSLSKIAKDRDCRFLVQGTIAPDWIETKGGIKTQHNVLEQVGIDPREKYGFNLIEPLANLYKDQVRVVARSLNIPTEISERQPFPGPGLVVRCVGKIFPDKLKLLKFTDRVVEERLSKVNASQYFAAVLDAAVEKDVDSESIANSASDILGVDREAVTVRMFRNKATGVKGGVRLYGRIIGVGVDEKRAGVAEDPSLLNRLQAQLISANPNITRVMFLIEDSNRNAPYTAATRAIKTRDFMTAEVSSIPWGTLTSMARRILKAKKNVGAVYYDITPKPPATIEFE